MANLFKSAFSTVCAGAKLAKETVKYVGRNANKGGTFVLDKATEKLDNLANKMQEKQVEEVKETKVLEAEVVK